MHKPKFILPAMVCLLIAVAGVWFWSADDPAAGPGAGAPQPKAGQASDHGTPATPETGSALIAREGYDDLVEYQITRTEQGFDEACGLATADFRVRRNIVIPEGACTSVIGWDPSFGEAAVLYSDRRQPLVIGSGARSLRLEPLPDNVITVEYPEAGDCELITHSVSPADWVFAVAESRADPRLDSVIVDTTCRVRAVYRGASRVSDWSNGTNVAALAPEHRAVSVHVEMANGRPVAGAVVHAIDDRGAVRDRGLTNELGEALLRVPVGWQRWVADLDGMVAGDSREMHGAKIVLGDARTIDIALSVEGDAAVLRGKVSWHGVVKRSALVESGRARLRDVAKGPVKLMLENGGPWAETDVPGNVVRHDWEIEATDFLSGVVEGIPAEIGTTFVLLHGAGPRAPAVIGPLGTFQFDNVPTKPLELRVVVRTNEGFERIVKTVQADPRQYTRIFVAPGELPSGALHLDVRSHGGGVSRGAWWPVRLTGADGRRRVFSGSVVDGVCDIALIPSGTYVCEISVPGWRMPYRAETTVRPLGVSSHYWELPEAALYHLTVDGEVVNDTRCHLGVRPVPQDQWIMVPRDREQPRWDLGPLIAGEYELAWFGNGVAPRIQRAVVDARNGGALSMAQERATSVTMKVAGLRWRYGEGTMVLRHAGKSVVRRTKGDCSKWEFALFPGQFSWELVTEREAGAGAFEVAAAGGEIVVYCR
jgi:hypothetical protein